MILRVFLGSTLSLLLLGAAAAQTPWTIETVDPNTDVYSTVALTTGRQGQIRIAYWDRANQLLRYAEKQGGTWSYETIEYTANWEPYDAIATDSLDNPHISYFAQTVLGLKHATKANGVWTIEVVDSNGRVGSFSSIVVGADGEPRISYYHDVDQALGYATKSGGSWAIEIPASRGGVTSQALDSEGNPHIIYGDWARAGVSHVYKNSGSWAEEAIPIPQTSSDQSALALDSGNRPHVGYFDYATETIRYARKSGGAWTTENVSGNGIATVAIALDGLDRPHMAWRNPSDHSVMYAMRDVGGWTVETVDSSGMENGWLDLAVDAQGIPLIAYRDDTEGKMHLAYRAITPTAVSGLASLDAVTSDEAIEIKWTVRSRDEYLGFNVLRSENDGPFARQTSEMIPNAAETFPATLSWTDAAVREGVDYAYRIEVIHPDGKPEVWDETVTGHVANRAPTAYAIRLLGPNPFRPDQGTEFEYAVPISGRQVSLAVYDVTGRRVRSLRAGPLPSGIFSERWHGRDDSGHEVPAGMYFVRLSWGTGSSTAERVVVTR